MKITLTGSLGHVARPLAESLLAAGHNITIVSSSEDRRAAIESMGAKAAIGSVADAAFLISAFTGADAVFAMTPPNFGGSNVVANTIAAGAAAVEAVRAAGVKRVVMLSSIGAHRSSVNGPIAAIHHIEQMYDDLPDVAVTMLRAGYFYINYNNDVPLIKHQHILGSNYSASTKVPLVHPRDIAAAATEALQATGRGKEVRYVVSDYRSAGDLSSVLGAAIGRPELPWVAFSDEQAVAGMTGAGLPEEIAALYAEMGRGLREGLIQEDFIVQGAPVTGATKLEDFAKEFAAAF